MNLDRVDSGRNLASDFNVIIEIPMNADPIKYEIDKETGALFVDRFVSTAMHYPCNYGYVPRTLADDGDPVDVLVITPYALMPGVVVRCRPIGLLKMKDEAGGEPKLLAAPDCTVRSGPNTAALVELYTSEGCSSCPPADQWLSSFARTRRALVVPIAFHVSYWDYIGWKDAYAELRFGERQRERAKASGASMVYTPQVMIGGRDFREWSSEAQVERRLEALNRAAPRAQIELRATAQPDGSLRPPAPAQPPPSPRAPHPAPAFAGSPDTRAHPPPPA